MLKNNDTATSFVLKKFIRVYQNGISPLLRARCRYYPTCSQYGLQAVAWHGSLKGGWLLAKRISRCHPLGGHGIDFVPLPLYRLNYQFFQHCNNDGFNASAKNNRFVIKNGLDYSAMLNVWLKNA